MRDFTPAEKAHRDRSAALIRRTYEAYGYREIETPALEDLARLTSGQGGENEKMLFRVMKRGLDESVDLRPSEAADLGLRFDLTLPLARFIASNFGSLPDVMRLIQIAPVWRAERPQKGRFRQFTQCDIDVIGEPGILAEIELISATFDALEQLSISHSFLRLNDREILLGLLEACGVDQSARERALISIDKIDKIGVEGVEKELLEKVELASSAVDKLVALLDSFLNVDRTDFDAVLKILPASISESAIARVLGIREGVLAVNSSRRVEFDVSLVRGMGYYTGPIFELGHPESSSSIAGGGRYDGMIGRFLGRDIPACGFSIGFERILDLVTLPAEDFKRIALLYDEDAPHGALVKRQTELIHDGYSVRLVRRPRKLATALERLKAEGIQQYAQFSTAETQPSQLRPIL